MYLLPLPAHIDWINSKIHGGSSNKIRILTGALLGIGSGVIAFNILSTPSNMIPYLVTTAYFALAAVSYFVKGQPVVKWQLPDLSIP